MSRGRLCRSSVKYFDSAKIVTSSVFNHLRHGTTAAMRLNRAIGDYAGHERQGNAISNLTKENTMDTTNTAEALQAQTVAEMVAELARLKAQNAELIASKAARQGNKNHALGNGLSCSIAPKGGVSVYGMTSKFPLTLYKAQWFRLFAVMANLRAFIEANDAKLSTKPVAVEEIK